MCSTSPDGLAGTLHRLGELDLDGYRIDARVGPVEGGRWLRRDDLLASGRLDEALDLVGRSAGTALPAVRATWLLKGYAWRLALPAVAALLAEPRVPRPVGRRVALRHDGGGALDATAFLSPRFAALRGDPATRGADAVGLPGDAGLAAWLRRGLVDHLTPLVDELRPRARRGHRALWASVEDIVSGLVLWIAQALGREREAQVEADLRSGSRRRCPGELSSWRSRTPAGARPSATAAGAASTTGEGSDGTACIDCGPHLGGRAPAAARGARNRLRLDLRGADAGAGCP